MNSGQGTGHRHPPTARIESVDLLKGWAVIVMIETHVANATLKSGIAQSGLFQWMTFFNGLVAPSFLFAAGMAYAVTTRRKAADYLAFGRPLFRQLGRILLILVVGYLLHLPAFSLGAMLEGVTEKEWLAFLQVDILQCIAISLFLMQALLLFLRSERRMLIVLSVLTPVVLIITPFLWWESATAHVPAPIAAYLNGLHFSLFPLFPWSVFLFSGALTGFLFSAMRQTAEGGRRFPGIVTAAGLGLIAGSFLLNPVAEAVYMPYDFWRYGPPFVLLRLGIVMLLLSGMMLYERRISVRSGSPVTLLGRESLLVYAVHLLLIYGDFGPLNFQKTVNHSYGYGEAVAATLVLLLLMYALALFWSRVKRESPRLRTAIMIAVPALFLLGFIFAPGA